MTTTPATKLKLGEVSPIPASPDRAVLDTVPSPVRRGHFLVRFTCPEFSSLCPVTGAPDFATIVIDYVPSLRMLESKSLKLFLHSFRNHGAFHETCVDMIGGRLITALDPVWMRVGGFFYPRGGIPIDVFWQTGELPKGIWLPETPVQPYRPRT